MQGGSITRIEKNVDRAASALFAMAAAYAAFACLAPQAKPPMLLTVAVGVASLAYLLSFRILNAVQPEAPRLHVPVFDVRQIDALEPTELLLTERYEPFAAVAEDDPLVLDDILEELGPDSRVVRLFDPAAMPTPGQLNARIERHLVGDPPQDASQALHDALAELRRSLR
ncbi:MAG TPA: hypothetical protein VFW35_12215 [Sphingomicrobium sp.]|nr:hypothetical protein [Sphingomicrobium sp.]